MFFWIRNKANEKTNHVANMTFSSINTTKLNPSSHISQAERQESFRKSLNIILVLTGQNLLNQADVFITNIDSLVFDDNRAGNFRIVDLTRGRQFDVGHAQRLDKSAHDLAGEFGQQLNFAVQYQRDEDIFFERFQHDVRDGARWQCHGYFKHVQRFVKSLHCCVDHAAVVVV